MNPGEPSRSGKTIGCIGKCTSGLTLHELDLITDHVQRTLAHEQGRKIFRKYLAQGQRKTDLACLDIYEQICGYVEKDLRARMTEKEPAIEPLIEDCNSAMNATEDLDGVSEIDLNLLEKYTEILADPSRDSLLSVLEETKIRLMDHLRQAHKGFREYAMEPCPKTP